MPKTSAAQQAQAMPVLQVDHLVRRYDDIVAVADVSFQVYPGEIVGLLGANGAGKTTTINMLMGVLSPSSGQIRIAGVDLADDRSRALQALNFAAVYAALPGNLTVRQNLRLFGMLYDVPRLAERIEQALIRFNIQHLQHRKCGVLSSGEQTRVALAKAMLNQPKLLLLDEPTASLDPMTAHLLRQEIRRFADEQGGGVLWISHNMAEVEAMCDRVLMMSKGRIVLQGTPQALPQSQALNSLEALFIQIAQTQSVQGDPR